MLLMLLLLLVLLGGGVENTVRNVTAVLVPIFVIRKHSLLERGRHL